MTLRSYIAGCGSYLPERCITNAELARQVGLSASACLGRTKRLKEAGVIKEKNGKLYEHFKGCIIVPFYKEDGSIGEIYGRSIFSEAMVPHKYLAGTHSGILNRKALDVFNELYLTECALEPRMPCTCLAQTSTMNMVT